MNHFEFIGELLDEGIITVEDDSTAEIEYEVQKRLKYKGLVVCGLISGDKELIVSFEDDDVFDEYIFKHEFDVTAFSR
jgi:hypothetical protein